MIGARWRSSVQLLDLRRHRARLGDPGRPARAGRGCPSSVPLQGATMCRASDMCRGSPMCADSQGFAATFADSRRFAEIRPTSWKFVAFCATSWRFAQLRGRGRGFVGNDSRGDALKPRGFANLNTRGPGMDLQGGGCRVSLRPGGCRGAS